MYQLLDLGLFSVVDTDSSVGVGWKLYFYQTGTTAPVNTYPTKADLIAGTNPNANPITLAADGRIPPVWVDQVVKCILKDEAGVTKQTVDPMNATAMLGDQGVNVLDFGAIGDGVTDDTDAIQDAIDYAFTNGLGQVDFPGPGYTFLLDGPFAEYGPGFYRGVLKIKSGVSLIGKGCELKLSGGRTDPGGIFYTEFWDNQPIDNVRVSGLVLDGNLANQTITIYPAGTPDGDIWQHGHLIAVAYARNFEVDHCVLKNARGDGVLWFTNDNGDVCENIHIHDNEFDNLFRQGCGASGKGIWIENNWFHGDGYWVAGIDIEIGVETDYAQDVWLINNRFDFRDGLSPTETTVSEYATDSADALAARTHWRRAISCGFFYAGFTGDTFNQHTAHVTIQGNKVWQGNIDCYNYGRVSIIDNHLRNTFEDLTYHFGAQATAIVVSSATGTTDIPSAIVRGNIIESDNDGNGIYCYTINRLIISGNIIKYCRKSGIRVDSCAGSVTDNDIEDVGQDDSGLASALIGSLSSGVAVFGGQTRTLHISNIRATETRSGGDEMMTYAVYANVSAAPLTRIEMVTGDNMASGLVKDVNNSTMQVGVVDAAAPRFNIPGDMLVSGDFTVNGTALFESLSGDLDVHFKAATASNRKLSFFDADGLQMQIAQLSGGTLNFNVFNDGSAVGTPLIIDDDGHTIANWDWENPIQVVGDGGAFGGFLWLASSGKWYVNGVRPTGDTDGTVLGTQV